MANTEEVKKKASEDRKLRIDHSDVYLENDRLSEELINLTEFLSRKRCRQAINRDQEIKELKKGLTSLQLTKTLSAVQSLRPHTSPATAPYSYARRLKPPPLIVRLDVKVPSKNDGAEEGGDTDHNNVNDVVQEDSETEESSADSDEDAESRAERIRRRQQRRRLRPPSSVLKGRRSHALPPDVAAALAAANGGAKKFSRQEHLLRQLDMEAVPVKWYTQVHQPADIALRRAHSAHAAFKSSHSASRRSSKTENKHHRRRAKTAFPASSTHDSEDAGESAIFCGGKHLQQKNEGLSRRQIMELTGVGKNSRPASGAERHRVQYLQAVRLERERLEARVKTFLTSCDRVGPGGLISTRKAHDYHSILLPESFYV